ncbi:MAG: hypothetical protein HRT89_06560 [Lentisphaeria bacterium]|nr:hypothetical protein [Lentisphaeria bacterium]NQZ67715.1 hypothetical protein [Lentisphaeria bacterium]
MKPLIIAHRGCSSLAPENTVESVKLALDCNADGIEIDVRLTADKQIVVTHDTCTDRISTENLEVPTTTYADLHELDIGSWKGSEWSGCRMALLETIFNLMPDDKQLLLEIKCGDEIIEPLKKLAQIFPAKLIIISFDYELLLKIKKQFVEIPVMWIVEKMDKTVLEKFALSDFDGLDFNIDVNTLDEMKDIAAGLKKESKIIYTWTMNDAQRLDELSFLDGITTDYPQDFNL